MGSWRKANSFNLATTSSSLQAPATIIATLGGDVLAYRTVGRLLAWYTTWLLTIGSDASVQLTGLWCMVPAVWESSTWPRLRVVQLGIHWNVQLASSLHTVPTVQASSTRPCPHPSAATRCACACTWQVYSATDGSKSFGLR